MGKSRIHLLVKKRTLGQPETKGGTFAMLGMFGIVRSVQALRYGGAVGQGWLRWWLSGLTWGVDGIGSCNDGYMVKDIDTGIEMRGTFQRRRE